MKQTISPQGNVPYDVGAASLFDTAYVHPLLRDSFLPWWYYDRFAKYTTWLVSGTQAGLDQWVGEISPERFHASKSEDQVDQNLVTPLTSNSLLQQILQSDAIYQRPVPHHWLD